MRALDPRSTALSFFALALASTAVGQASWQLAYPAQSPPPDYLWAHAFDEVHGEAILMFPWNQSNQAWRWNGSTWSQLSGPLPPNRFEAYMVWDAARQRIVLFGGTVPGTGQFFQDLWEWNGLVWQQRFAAMPPGRRQASIAYDRARGVTVMFGGTGGPLFNDTWEWNGVGWTNPNPAVRPSPRFSAPMAFDPVTQRVLLHGGSSGVWNSETWTWDGTTWQQHFPSAPPFLRDRPATMVADLSRARTLLFGGSTYDFQTWEWDGGQWHASIPNSPGAWNGAAMVYDTVRREVVLHGGENGMTMNQTWRYRTATPATATSFGSGCAGSLGVPLLANVTYHLPWLGDTVQNRVNVAPAELGALFVSSFAQNPVPLSLAAIGMPGCDLLLPLDVVEFRTAVTGFATWSLAIPNTASLVSVAIHQQAFPFDAAANPFGLAASNGLSMTTGIR